MTPHLSIVSTVDPDRATMRDFGAAVARYAAQQTMPVELILVDDLGAAGSAEWPAGDTLRVVVLRDQPGSGQLRALLRGIAAAGGDAVLTIDPDMAGNIADIDRLLHAQRQGHAVVYGRRVLRADTPPARRLGSRIFNALHREISGIPLHDFNTPLRLFTREACRRLPELPDTAGEFSLYLYRAFAGRTAEVTVQVAGNRGRRSTYRLPALIRLFCGQLHAAWRFRRNAAQPVRA